MKNLLTAYQNSFTPSSPSSKLVDRSQVLEDRTPSTLIVLHSLVQFYSHKLFTRSSKWKVPTDLWSSKYKFFQWYLTTTVLFGFKFLVNTKNRVFICHLLCNMKKIKLQFQELCLLLTKKNLLFLQSFQKQSLTSIKVASNWI